MQATELVESTVFKGLRGIFMLSERHVAPSGNSQKQPPKKFGCLTLKAPNSLEPLVLGWPGSQHSHI